MTQLLIPHTVGPTSVTLTGPTDPVPAGSEITLSCSSVGGLPHPTLTISKVGGSTSLASGSSPQTANYTPSETDDQAKFECKATNKVGSVRDSLVISVTGKNVFKGVFGNQQPSRPFISAGPASVAISRSLPAGDVELGASLQYTCASTGGIPTPTVTLFVGGTSVKSGLAPTLSHTLATDTAMHNAEVKCQSENVHGRVNDVETLQLYSMVKYICDSFTPL